MPLLRMALPMGLLAVLLLTGSAAVAASAGSSSANGNHAAVRYAVYFVSLTLIVTGVLVSIQLARRGKARERSH